MRYRDGRRSLCLSSQSGCPLTCTFCATGQMAFGRNLTASEIVDQALHFRRVEQVDHAVFMGMGEPMLNLDEVLGAARRLPALGITHRRTTISTVGWLPGLKRFVDEVDEPIRLALSLHAPDDELRSRIMPVNAKYPLRDVLTECRRHYAATNRRVFVEYVMLDGVNDSPAQARALAELLGDEGFKVNLIPYNPTGMYDGSPRARIAAFKSELDRARVPAHRPVDARPRHRGGVRPAGGGAEGSRPGLSPLGARRNGACEGGGRSGRLRADGPRVAVRAHRARPRPRGRRLVRPQRARGSLALRRGPRRLQRARGRAGVPAARHPPRRARARRGDGDVPLGGRPGRLPRRGGRGAPRRRGAGAPAATVGLRPLSPRERST